MPYSIFLVLEKDQKEDIFMAKKTNSDVKLTDVRKNAKKYNQTEQVEISHGEYEGQTITFNPYFSDQKIEELFQEFSMYQKQLTKKEIELSEASTMNLTYMLAIKKFTHFGRHIPDRLFANDKKNEGILDWMEHFADTGLIKVILEDIFMPVEVQKLIEKMVDILGRSFLTDSIMEKAQLKAQELELKNKEVFEQFAKKQDKLIQEHNSKVENEVVN
jgi:hypothetical protein